MPMNPCLQGALARDTGTEFEKSIAQSLRAYAMARIAYLDFVPVPMTPCGMRHPHTKAPLYIPKGKAPFDIYGYTAARLTAIGTSLGTFAPAAPHPQAVFVGAELKATSESETSLAIVKPNAHGSGLAYHQLAALAQVAREGGIARIVWDNGGDIGVLDNDAIVAAHAIYESSLQSELRGKGKGPNGARSVRWDSFRRANHANIGGTACIDWLQIGGRQ